MNPNKDFPRAKSLVRGFQASPSAFDAFARLIADGEFVASLLAARCQDFAPVFSRHALSEPVFVASFAIRRLKSAFHELCKFSNFVKRAQRYTFRSSKTTFYVSRFLVLLRPFSRYFSLVYQFCSISQTKRSHLSWF
jgi:hypothetical protein